MILVTGANGRFAGAVIEALRRRDVPFAVCTRSTNSERAIDLSNAGISVRYADFDEPESLEAAMIGVRKVLIISTMSPNDIRYQQNLAALNAATNAGVRHVVYTSFLSASATAHAEHSRLVHFPTEQAIVSSGLKYTILRHALYAENWTTDLGATLASGKLQRPGGTTPCAFIPIPELGASAATILATDGHEDRVYSETMPEALTGAQIASLMSEVFDRPVAYERVAPEDWPIHMHAHWGVPLEAGMSAIGTMQGVEAGEFNVVSENYAQVMGSPARTWKKYLQDLKAQQS